MGPQTRTLTPIPGTKPAADARAQKAKSEMEKIGLMVAGKQGTYNELVKQGKFDDARKALAELRSLWSDQANAASIATRAEFEAEFTARAGEAANLAEQKAGARRPGALETAILLASLAVAFILNTSSIQRERAYPPVPAPQPVAEQLQKFATRQTVLDVFATKRHFAKADSFAVAVESALNGLGCQDQALAESLAKAIAAEYARMREMLRNKNGKYEKKIALTEFEQSVGMERLATWLSLSHFYAADISNAVSAKLAGTRFEKNTPTISEVIAENLLPLRLGSRNEALALADTVAAEYLRMRSEENTSKVLDEYLEVPEAAKNRKKRLGWARHVDHVFVSWLLYQRTIMEATAQKGSRSRPNEISGLYAHESGFITFAVSSAGAKGIPQVMDQTAAELGIGDPYDILQSIPGGARHWSWLASKYRGMDERLMSYNWGAGNLDDFKDDPTSYMPDETKNYPKSVKYYVRFFNRIYPEGAKFPPMQDEGDLANKRGLVSPASTAQIPSQEAKFRHQQAAADCTRPFFLAQAK